MSDDVRWTWWGGGMAIVDSTGSQSVYRPCQLRLSASLLVETLDSVNNSAQLRLNLGPVSLCRSRDEFPQAFPIFCLSSTSLYCFQCKLKNKKKKKKNGVASE